MFPFTLSVGCYNPQDLCHNSFVRGRPNRSTWVIHQIDFKKESPPISFRMLSITQSHVLKLRLLNPNLKQVFWYGKKIIRVSKIREYGYAWGKMCTLTTPITKNGIKFNHMVSFNFESHNFNLIFWNNPVLKINIFINLYFCDFKA